jgi:hypothetical protein
MRRLCRNAQVDGCALCGRTTTARVVLTGINADQQELSLMICKYPCKSVFNDCFGSAARALVCAKA